MENGEQPMYTYDHFTQEQVCGVFTPWHFVALAVFTIAMVIAVDRAKRLNEKQIWWLMFAIAVLVTVEEIVKIALRLSKGQDLYSWVPLYFCSLFIYAIWFALCKNKFIKNMGNSFLVCGGIVASLCYTIYPTTSLLSLPIWHPASLHGLSFHWLMCFTGILLYVKGIYRPKKKDFIYYFTFTTLFTVITYIINICCGVNLMFINWPYEISILQKIYDTWHFGYTLLVYLAQSVALFWVVYGLDRLTQKRSKKPAEEDVVNNGQNS